MNSKGNFYGQINQYVRYVHSCPQLAILIKMGKNHPSQKSVVLESSAKPKLRREFGGRFRNQPGQPVWQKFQEPPTQHAKLGKELTDSITITNTIILISRSRSISSCCNSLYLCMALILLSLSSSSLLYQPHPQGNHYNYCYYC